jgi:DNA repair protein RadD
MIQQIGRGSRLAPSKFDCLVLDFAGNIRRHGTVDDPLINVTGRLGSIPGMVSTTTCPQCQEENSQSARACVCCGHVLVSDEPRVYAPRTPRHGATADEVPILGVSVSPNCWLPVQQSDYRSHQKRNDPNAPPTLRVDHLSGFSPYSEYISFESAKSYAWTLAHGWWRAMGGHFPAPTTVAEAVTRQHELGRVLEIQVSRNGQWWRIHRRRVQRTDCVLVEIDHRYRCFPVPPETQPPETQPPQTLSEIPSQTLQSFTHQTAKEVFHG